MKIENFNPGDLLKLKEGFTKFPYYDSLEEYEKDPTLAISGFNDKPIIVLSVIVSERGKTGYKCLSQNKLMYVFDVTSIDGHTAEVGFCYEKIGEKNELYLF